MVALNRTIAAAMVHGPELGLDLLQTLDTDARLAGHYRLDAVRGHLLEMAGNREQAIERYRAAAARTASLPERDYLIGRAARLAAALVLRAPFVIRLRGRIHALPVMPPLAAPAV